MSKLLSIDMDLHGPTIDNGYPCTQQLLQAVVILGMKTLGFGGATLLALQKNKLVPYHEGYPS